jgi:prepilin-type N-terminal cleavage/methylation domain-containing protein
LFQEKCIDKHSSFYQNKGGVIMKKINKRGITLIELVAVFAIIAIGAALAVPSIGSWLPHYRLRSATRDITSTLRVAQMKAVSTNLDHRVSFTEGTGSVGSFVLERNTGGLWVSEGEIKTLPQGIQLTTNFTGERVVFKPNSSVEQAGTISLLYPPKGTTRTITVLLSTGRISIQ